MSESTFPPLPPLAQSHFEDPYHQGSADHATHIGEMDSPDGGRLCLELLVDDDGLIVEAWFDGEGSAWLLAAASIFVESIEGCVFDDVRSWSDDRYLASGNMSLEGTPLTAWLAPLQLLRCQLKNSEGPGFGDDENEDGPRFSGPHLGEEC
jgi:NifU-like protein involved in Fe-S cluster formation